MTVASIKWWNKVIKNEDDSAAEPELPQPEEMLVCMQDLSPVFHNQVSAANTFDDYWEQIHKCLVELSGDWDIPSPFTDLNGFVEKLYNYRNNIKITCPEYAVSFAQRCCHEGSNNFFMSDFLFGVSDPFISVKAMYIMNTQKLEPWVSFTHQYGVVERLFDLFSTYLQPATKTIENDYEEFRVFLADIITSLLCDGQHEFKRKVPITDNLFSRLLNLIVYSKTDASISFARYAIRLNDETIDLCPVEDKLKRFMALMNSAPQGKLAHQMVFEYTLSHAGKTVPYKLVASQISKKLNDVYDFILLAKLANTVHDARFIAVKALAKVLAHSKLFVKLAGKLLSEIFNQHGNDDDIIGWFQLFIVKIFIFFRLAAKKHKFLRRIHLICEAMSTDTFMLVPFLKKTLVNTATSAFRMGGCDFIEDYFPINYDKPIAKSFICEYERTERYKIKLKTFPFKIDTVQLIEFGKKKDDKMMSTRQAAHSTEGLSDLGLTPQELRYIFRDDRSTTFDQQNCIFTLEDFIDTEKEKLDKVKLKKRKHRNLKPNMTRFRTEGRQELTGLRVCISENGKAIVDYQVGVLSDFMNIARDLINLIRTKANLMADTKLLLHDLNKGGVCDDSYKLLKLRKIALRKNAAIYSRRNLANKFDLELQQNMVSRTLPYDSSLQYSSIDFIDIMLMDYLKRSMFIGMIDATSASIEDGTIDACASMSWELHKVIMDELAIPYNQNAIILYNSLMRILFDNSYILHGSPCLNRYKTASLDFATKAYEFSKQPMSHLNLSSSIVSFKCQSRSIASFYANSKLTLVGLQFFTNPFEILMEIHRVLTAIPSISNSVKLTQQETETLFFGLLVSNPPINTISIGKYLMKWGNIMPSIQIQNSRRVFSSCVSRLFNLETAKDDL